jgi:hypothetical protein
VSQEKISQQRILDEIRKTIEHSWVMLESGQGERGQLEEAILASLALLLEYPAEPVLATLRRSFLPTPALVKWMLYEAQAMPWPLRQRASEVALCWQSQDAQSHGGSSGAPAA